MAPVLRTRSRRIIVTIVLLLVVAIALVIAFWNWDWFIPLVESRASAAAGRRVTLTHLHVKLGRTTTIAADGIEIANPDSFAAPAPFGRIERVTVVANLWDYLLGRGLVLPQIALEQPRIEAISHADGQNNFTPPAAKSGGGGAPPQIGDLVIHGGVAHFVSPQLKADFLTTVETRQATAATAAAIVMETHGTYTAQPITGRFMGGALLSLRDAAHPYPIDLRLVDGPTKLSLIGTVQNPLNFAGAHLRLAMSGPDMSRLLPLTGVPIPPTPPFSIAGNLTYAAGRVQFHGFVGRVGLSDLGGDIDGVRGPGGKPDVTMKLTSKNLDLTDLGGFVGAVPGKAATPGQTTSQLAAHAAAAADPNLLSSTPISLPSLRSANIHASFTGQHIVNKYMPFDNLVARIDLVDGRIDVNPLNFGVGNGEIASHIELAPGPHDILHTGANIRFRHIDISRVMQATHLFKGHGILGGEAILDSNGNSVASMFGQGNGELKLALLGGGNLSALLVDISGLQFGNAVLSALGVPNRANLQCFVTDLPLRQGVSDVKAFLIDTDEGRITATGRVDFRDQTIDYAVTTRTKHFSVGSLPGPIDITGKLGKPGIAPGAEVVARAGAAAGLGVLLTPLGALLPTIQFGVGDDNACTRATQQEQQPILATRHTAKAHK